MAQRLGAEVHRRSADISGDAVTLDPVVHDALVATERRLQVRFDLVVTLQPTSPMLRTASLDAAIGSMLADPAIDTTISATDDTHLSWRRDGEQFVPAYAARVNRQYLPKAYRETGGFVVARRACITVDSRIGARVRLHLLGLPESIDIDHHADWGLCSYYLRRRRVAFVVTGHREVGLGHVYNALLVANDLMDHDLIFLVDSASRLAFDTIEALHYPVYMQTGEDLVADIARLEPDIVVNDCLDTGEQYMRGLRALGVRTVNVEDLGPGALLADAVVNAIYPDAEIGAHARTYFGPEYACLRDEFVLTEPRPARASVERVLITFGGTDPSNLTVRVLDAIEAWCAGRGIAIDVVTGLGFPTSIDLTRFRHARVHRGVRNISEFMRAADVAFTSAGRTVFELAAVGTPAVVLSQNSRELTHTFASERHGFLNLGLGEDAAVATILDALRTLVEHPDRRVEMRQRMLDVDLKNGRHRVARIIDEIVRLP